MIADLLLADVEFLGDQRLGHRLVLVEHLQDVLQDLLGEDLVLLHLDRLRSLNADDLLVDGGSLLSPQRIVDLRPDIIRAVASRRRYQVGPAGDVDRELHILAFHLVVHIVDHLDDAHEVRERYHPEPDIRNHRDYPVPHMLCRSLGAPALGVQEVEDVYARDAADHFLDGLASVSDGGDMDSHHGNISLTVLIIFGLNRRIDGFCNISIFRSHAFADAPAI